MWLLSQVIKTVIGVHAFGFDDSGTKRETNHDPEDPDDLEREQARQFALQAAYFVAMPGQPTLADPVPHDYNVNTVICEISQTWCTLANIACWGRHFHAPRDDEDYSQPAEHGDDVDLEGIVTPNPIRVGVGADAGLPPNAIGNVTRPGHIFHDVDGPGWPTCPQTVTDQGAGTPPPVDTCSQVYREPDQVGNQILMRTRGTGDNPFGVINQIFGPGVFEELDELMKQAILESGDGICPSL
ncbi:MAG: hypothetical protein AAF541_07920 [Pseudomonadota bacterium]